MDQSAGVSPVRSGLTARCFGCRNRFGLRGLLVLESGVVCCRRCWARREVLQIPDLISTGEVVG